MATENALYSILVEKIRQDALVLPTLPEIALKVRQAADDTGTNLQQLGEIISQDPALSLGMIKVANSVIFGRRVKAETVHQAVTRIGLRQIKSIATAMALEHVFVSKNEFISTYMKKSWSKSIDVTSVAIVLMNQYLATHKHQHLTLDTITLAGLVHNIGILPILTEAENHQDIFANPTFLKQAISKLSNKIGMAVSKSWEFSDEFTDIIGQWSDLSVLPEEINYIDFIRAGAIYHEVFKNENTRSVLLKSYVKKELMPSEDYMESDEFKNLVKETKSMFL